MSASRRMPAVFVGHGSPMNAIEQNRYTQAWSALGAALPVPRAVLAVSAHWFVRGVAVTANEQPRTIHDFYGFARELYRVRYEAPGDPALARHVSEMLGTLDVALDESWGLDHGAWSVLLHLYPDADVPVVQFALDATKPADLHWAIGAALAPLRDEGVLILGSGNVVHNLAAADFGIGGGFDWAMRFDRHVRDALERGDAQALIRYDAHPDGALAVPTPEHYLPLLYVAALRAPGEPVETIVDGLEAGAISMRSVRIG
ncbi:MAG TPA: 4,5-DOPA dioxygenase extradiol [Verrucomicrobiae bacterium]|nr:4,5-DOPA dioxygenase extradiol [Verrucomicrobiae bacterium]